MEWFMLIACISALVLFFVCFFFFKTVRSLFFLVGSTALGWIGLCIWNTFEIAALTVGVNPASASVVGVLGLPGFVLLLLLALLL